MEKIILTNIQMREFLEKDLLEIKNRIEQDRPIHPLRVDDLVEALDKAVEDVRKLRDSIRVNRVKVHYQSHYVDETRKSFMCGEDDCKFAIELLEQTSWAEKN